MISKRGLRRVGTLDFVRYFPRKHRDNGYLIFYLCCFLHSNGVFGGKHPTDFLVVRLFVKHHLSQSFPEAFQIFLLDFPLKAQ